MHRKSLIIGAALSVGVLAGVYAYDSSRDDLIAKGVSVAGMDVGGMRANGAQQRLEAALGPAVERPVVVSVAGRRFRLTAEQSQVLLDSQAMVDDAVSKSRSGGLPSRLWRAATGGRVEAALPLRVRYSRAALRGFALHVKQKVDRPVRDARLRLGTASSLPVVPSRPGLRLNRARLGRSLKTAVSALGAGRRVQAKVGVVKPKLTTAQLGRRYRYFITVDRPAFRLRLFEHLKLSQTYSIAVGRVGLETPAGLYHIQDKQVDPSWHVPNSEWAGKLAGKVIPPGPDDPLKSRWMGIFAGAGIHGTDDLGSLGSAASHGCIRMSIPDVERLYDQVPIRTPVYIQ